MRRSAPGTACGWVRLRSSRDADIPLPRAAVCAATCAGGSARASLGSAAIWAAARSAVLGPQPFCVPART
eukprot:8651642-Alexandrium_andersonii.AAC.1